MANETFIPLHSDHKAEDQPIGYEEKPDDLDWLRASLSATKEESSPWWVSAPSKVEDYESLIPEIIRVRHRFRILEDSLWEYEDRKLEADKQRNEQQAREAVEHMQEISRQMQQFWQELSDLRRRCHEPTLYDLLFYCFLNVREQAWQDQCYER